MTPRQRKFAETYAKGTVSAAEAARAAGYSPKSAARTASRLLKQQEVSAYVRDLQTPEGERTRNAVLAAAAASGITSESIQAILWSIANEADASSTDKLAALKLLAQLKGLIPFDDDDEDDE